MKARTKVLRRVPLSMFTFLLLMILLPAGVRPGQARATTTTPPATPAAAPAATPAATSTVKWVEPGTTEEHPLQLGHEIKVKVANLEALLKEVNGDLKKIVLHVDGHPLTGLTPRRLSTSGGNADTLAYNLAPPANDQQRKAWHALLGRPSLLPPEPKKVSVSVGEEGRPIESEVTGAQLEVIDGKWLWVFMIALAALMIGFFYIARKSDLLRDPGPDPWELNEQGEQVKKLRKPYSLARTQMALWFFVVFASYLFIWLVTDSLVSLTTQVLGLIGISAGTAAGAAVIDANKRGALEKRKEDLERKKNALISELASLGEQVTAAEKNLKLAADADKMALTAALAALQANQVAKKITLRQVRDELDKLEASAKPLTSGGFLVDILSDDYGISFHRFQIFAWTLALIIIFITSVYKVLTIPLFDVTLLALMGISSGTYLLLKVPEPRTPPADATPAPAPVAGDAAAKQPGAA